MLAKKIFVIAAVVLAVLLASCDGLADPDRILENAGVSFYTVTFNANGATSGNAPETIKAPTGRQISLPLPRPMHLSRQDHIFGGWNTRADGTGTNYAPNMHGDMPSFTPTENITLYAQWVYHGLTVTGIPSGNNGRFLHFDNGATALNNRIIGAASVTGGSWWESLTVTGVEISGTTVELPMWSFINGEWQRISDTETGRRVSGHLKITNGSTGTAGRTLSGDWSLHAEQQLSSITLINGSAVVSWQ